MTVTHDPAALAAPAPSPAAPCAKPRPYWLREPCPPWCGISHGDYDSREDRLHSRGQDSYIELTLEPRKALGGETFPATISAGMWMHWRDARPHICILINDEEEILLELNEAEEAARLLAAPSDDWEPVVLTMMEPDDSLPPGHRAGGMPLPEHVRFLSSPFSRPAVFAARRRLDDEVLVYSFSLRGDNQAPRYLVFTRGEAAQLAAAIVKLLDGAR